MMIMGDASNRKAEESIRMAELSRLVSEAGTTSLTNFNSTSGPITEE